MIRLTWLAWLLLAGPVEELVPVNLGAVEIALPKTWQKSTREGTVHFSAPSGEAYLDADVGTVQTSGMQPQACVDKIIQGLGGKDWRARRVENAPAAVKVEVDTDAQGKQFVSYTFIGCNGKTTWALSFHWVGTKDEQFAPLADKVASTLRYRRRAGR